MSPSGSKRGWRAGPAGTGEAGFSLIELLVAMVVAVLLGVAVVRFYKDSYHAYSMQDQIADRNQNAQFTLNKFVEALQQAGSALPDSGWPVIKMSGGTLILGVNPRGAEQYNGTDLPWSNFIPVTDASKFANTANVLVNTTHVLVEFADPAKAVQKLNLDLAYNSGGFSRGIKDNATGLDSIRVTAPINLSAGDKIYGYREDEYSLSGSDLIIRPNGNAAMQMVLSENIDSVGFTFLTVAGTPTTNWKWMRSASITVRARNERPDPKLPAPGWHMISLPMNVILRNKI
jgi:prepilin-type N-terminal cleavage/methylation domain-containing protein